MRRETIVVQKCVSVVYSRSPALRGTGHAAELPRLLCRIGARIEFMEPLSRAPSEACQVNY